MHRDINCLIPCSFREVCRDTSRGTVATTPRVLYTQTSSRNVCYKRVSRRKKKLKKPRGEGETRNNGCGVFRAEPFVTPRCERFSQRVERDRGMYSGEFTTNQPPIWSEANTGNGLYSLIGSLLMYSVIRSQPSYPLSPWSLPIFPYVPILFLLIDRFRFFLPSQLALSREEKSNLAATSNYKWRPCY